MKIVVLDGYTLNPGDLSWGELEKLGELTVYDRTPEDKVLERIGDAEIVYTNKTPLTRETFYKAPNLRWVGVLATGYNVVDVEAARNAVFRCQYSYLWHRCCCPDGFALLLEICHHVWEHSEAVKRGLDQ